MRFKNNPTQILFSIISLIAIVGMACDLGALIPANVQFGQPEPTQETLFKGIVYQRLVQQSPRPMVIHIVTVDLKADGLSVLVTPGDPDSSKPVEARTTSDFLSDFGMSLAVNGGAFHPWSDLGPLGYSPKAGEATTPFGFSASRGVIYSQDTDEEPTLYIYKNNKASIDSLIGKVFNAISGQSLLIKNGAIIEGLNTSDPEPRTAIGLNRAGSQMVIIIVDGRQSGYSEGATLFEMADLLKQNNVFRGINMDGGGSSTLVMADENGNPVLLNSPIHGGNPGTERPVANHLGFSAK